MRLQQFDLPDGRRLAWREAGSGPPLVLVHGWAGSALVFAEVAQLLAERYRVLLPDLPGHGHSEPAVQPALATFADDLYAWLKTVVAASVCLAGWSLGGMVALELARKDPQSVDRLILVGTTPRFTTSTDWPHGLPAAEVRALRRNLERRFAPTLTDFFRLTLAGDAYPPHRVETIRRTMIQPAPLPDPATAAALLAMLADQDQLQMLPAIRVPTLVLHGDNDQVVPVGAAERLAAALPASRLVRWAGVGHAPFWSRPESAAELFREAQA